MRLTDLDRELYWVIGHNGRRWETVASLEDFLSGHQGVRDADAADASEARRMHPHAAALVPSEVPQVAGHPRDPMKPPPPRHS